MNSTVTRPEEIVRRLEALRQEINNIEALVPGLVMHDLQDGDLMGVSEVAKAVGVDPTLISVWYRRNKLPPPVAKLAATPVWTRNQIDLLIKLSEHLQRELAQADA